MRGCDRFRDLLREEPRNHLARPALELDLRTG